MCCVQTAAKSLNVRLATLKVHLRVLGVSKWPSRKRSSIRKLLRHCPDLQGRPKQMVHQTSPNLYMLFQQAIWLPYWLHGSCAGPRNCG